ncbi:MAG: peptidylprolyl isomerase, partial [Candidatus Eisenbacteria bacterium]|nr:peptidylprolyl isomerase [Candidatus Eisenbacteria bacterium]
MRQQPDRVTPTSTTTVSRDGRERGLLRMRAGFSGVSFRALGRSLFPGLGVALLSVALLPALLLSAIFRTADAQSATEGSPVLVTVNGESITAHDLDQELIASHMRMDEGDRGSHDYRGLVDKLIHDRLLVQEAYATGVDADPGVQRQLEEKLEQLAIRRYVRDHFQEPDSVSEAAVRDFFQQHYFKVQVRQLSMRTEEEVRDVAARIAAGADMDSLARALSLDTHRLTGGLRNLIYWADLETALRAPAEKLAVGQLSAPFPFREAYSVIRLEKRTDVDWDAYDTMAPGIRAGLQKEARERAWAQFTNGLQDQYPVSVDRVAMGRIVADSAQVFSGVFLRESTAPVLSVDRDRSVSEADLRREISHQAMGAGKAPFDSLVRAGVDAKSRDMVLSYAAEQAGSFDAPDVQAAYAREETQILLQAYLAETLVPQIKFRRDEFQAYYDENKDRYRG